MTSDNEQQYRAALANLKAGLPQQCYSQGVSRRATAPVTPAVGLAALDNLRNNLSWTVFLENPPY